MSAPVTRRRFISLAAVAALSLSATGLFGCQVEHTSYRLNGEFSGKEYPPYANKDQENADFDAVDAARDALSRIGATLARTLEPGNCVFSPFGVLNTLGMIQPATSEAAGKQIVKYLGIGMPLKQLMGGVAFMLKDFYESQEVSHAALVLYAGDLTLQQEYRTFLESYSDAQVMRFDPTKDQDLRAKLNAYAKERTKGLIPNAFPQPIPPNLKALLVDILAFEGKWQQPFDQASTKEMTFNGFGKDGKRADAKVPFMQGASQKGSYLEHADFKAVSLPFDGSSNMIFILPEEGKDAREVLGTVLKDKIWNGKMNGAEGSVKLPKFDLAQTHELIKALKKEGVTELFDDNKAPLINMTSPENPELYVGLYEQVARIVVDEKGAKAAAVTKMGVKEAAMPLEKTFDLTFDRPFAYLILNDGCPIFMGTVYTLAAQGNG